MPSCCGGELDRAGDQTKTTLPMGVYPLGVYNVFSWVVYSRLKGPLGILLLLILLHSVLTLDNQY
jgi:hypothetical protein